MLMDVDVSMSVDGSSDVCICGSVLISWHLGDSGSEYAIYIWSASSSVL